jgi:hypothetical protein
MLDKADGGDEVGVGLWVGWAGRVTAIFRVVAGVVLWPKSVYYKAKAVAALCAAAVCGAEFRRPGQIEQVVVEVSGSGLYVRTASAASCALRLRLV